VWYNCIWSYICEDPALAFGELCDGVDLWVVEDVLCIWSWHTWCAFFEGSDTFYFLAKLEAVPLFAISALNPSESKDGEITFLPVGNAQNCRFGQTASTAATALTMKLTLSLIRSSQPSSLHPRWACAVLISSVPYFTPIFSSLQNIHV
jgi:hypothetical protein